MKKDPLGTCALWSALLLLVTVPHTSHTIKLEELEQMLNNDVEMFCSLTQCEGAMMRAEDCLEGSRWIEGITVSGCCGGCVKFLQEGEGFCTGKIDPEPCKLGLKTGYGTCGGPAKRAGARSAMLPPRHDDHQQRQSLAFSLRNTDSEANVLYSSWCDYGMFCSSTYQCSIAVNWVECQNIQYAYDRDLREDNYLGYRDDYRWRPDCMPDGSYGPKQCKTASKDETQSCICVKPDGGTLPGKAFSFQRDLYKDMNCLCSRSVYERQERGLTINTLHCAENGNYEELQCEDKWCYCIHPENGTFWGSQMPMAGVNLLPCYNRTLMGDLYERKCDSRDNARNILVDAMERKGISNKPSAAVTCNYDGSYATTHCAGSSCDCYNKYGAKCQSYGSSGCDCVGDRLKFQEYGDSYDQLTCDGLNGAYQPIQEWPSSGVLFSVDKEGTRVSPVVRITCEKSLSESELELCQKLGNSLPEEDNPQGHCSKSCVVADQGTDYRCPRQAYLFNEDFFVGEYCLDTLPPTK